MATGDEIRAAREKRGLSQQDLADAVGISQPAIQKIEDGRTRKSRYLHDIEKFLHMDKKINVESKSPVEPYSVETDIFGPRDLKLFAAAEGGPGEMVVDNEPIDFLPRPWYLGPVTEGYAVLISGESMFPSFRPGQIAIVNPRMPLLKGADTLFFKSADDDGTFVASIKSLVRWTVAEWHVEQFNPPEGEGRFLTFDRKVWRAHRIVGRFDG